MWKWMSMERSVLHCSFQNEASVFLLFNDRLLILKFISLLAARLRKFRPFVYGNFPK